MVIPAYDAADTLAAQLDALATQKTAFPWEVIVVDDGSTDATLAVAERYRERLPLRVARCAENRGAAHAKNVGIRAAASDRIAVADADDVVGAGWLAAARDALERHPAAVSRFDIERLNPPAIRGARAPRQVEGLQSYDYPPFLPHAGASGLMIRREVFDAVGGFDETLPSLEDTDFTWRVQLAGQPIAFCPDALLYVRFRETTTANARQGYSYGFANVALYHRYRGRGMPKIDPRRGLHTWAKLLNPRRLFGLRRRAARERWVRSLAFHWGRVMGSLHYRVWAL